MRFRILLCMVFIIASLNSISVSAKSKDPDMKQFKKEIMEFFEHIREAYEQYAQEQEDIKLLAEVIYHENWHTDKDKLTARWTGAVVMNRVKSSKFPNTIKEVLYQKNPTQYSTTKKFFTVPLPQEVYDMAEDIIRNGTPDVPETVLYQATFVQGKVWKRLNGEVFCFG